MAQLVSDDSMPPPLLAGTTTSQPGPFSGTRGGAAFAPPAPGGGPMRSLRSISLWRSSSLMSVWTILSSSVCSSLRSASSSPSYISSHTPPHTKKKAPRVRKSVAHSFFGVLCYRTRLGCVGGITSKALGLALSCSNCPLPITTCSSFSFPKALLIIRPCE